MVRVAPERIASRREGRMMAHEILYDELSACVIDLAAGTAMIDPSRRVSLDGVADYVRGRASRGASIRLTFICTHNSRRSHVAQIWAQAAAAHYGIDGVETYSGGTEATAFAAPAIASVHRHGFRVEKDAGRDNPHVLVRYAPEVPALDCWSKVYDDPANPSEGFGAVMVCSSADVACPIVPGADARFVIPYVDPKVSDGTEAEAATYDERTREIGREMLYVFGRAAA